MEEPRRGSGNSDWHTRNHGGTKDPPDKINGNDNGQDMEMEAVTGLPNSNGKKEPILQKHQSPSRRSFIEVVQGKEKHVPEYEVIEPPPVVDGSFQVEIDRVIEKDTEKDWGHCLVGSFQGPTFKPHILQARLAGIWRTRAAFKVIPLEFDHYLFKFDDLDDKLGVLLGGPWFVGHHRLSLRLWDIDFDLTNDKIRHVPVWIRLQGLPLKFWQADVILKITAAAGKPLKLDNCTVTKQSGRFARICVEVDLDKPLTKGVVLKSTTKTQWQNFIYADIRKICNYCMFAGHTTSSCKKMAEEKPKETQSAVMEEDHNLPQNMERRNHEETETWSMAVRTRRRSRKPVPVDGRKSVPVVSVSGAGKPATQASQNGRETREVTVGDERPSNLGPKNKEIILERFTAAGRYQETSQIDNHAQGVNRFNALIVEDSQFEFTTKALPSSVTHENPNFQPDLVEQSDVNCAWRKETVGPSHAHSKDTQLAAHQPTTSQPNEFASGPNLVPLHSKAQPNNLSTLFPKSFQRTAVAPAGRNKPMEKPNKPNSSSTIAVSKKPGTPPTDPPATPIPSDPLALLPAPFLADSLVIDISPSQTEAMGAQAVKEMVIYDPSIAEIVKAKEKRTERMELCRLTGNKTKGVDQLESTHNSSEPGRYKKATKIAKTTPIR